MAFEPKKRSRNIGHAWWDKRVVRFFRKRFDKLHYKNLRSVYIALCEIDSDFTDRSTKESLLIGGFTTTVATYAGMNVDTIRPYLKALHKAYIIDYEQQSTPDGKFSGTRLTMYLWEEDEAEDKYKIITRVLSNQLQRTKDPHEFGSRDFQGTENPGDGRTRAYTYDTYVSSVRKNSKEDDDDIGRKLKNGDVPRILDVDHSIISPKAEKVVEMYRKYCPSFPKVIRINDARKKTINARLQEFSLTIIKQAFQKAEASDFLSGRSGQWNASTSCNFDWILNPTNIVKILEGNYDNKDTRQPTKSALSTSKETPEQVYQRLGVPKEYIPSVMDMIHNEAEDLFQSRSIAPPAPAALAEQIGYLLQSIKEAQADARADPSREYLIPGFADVVISYLRWFDGPGNWVTNIELRNFSYDNTIFQRFLGDESRHQETHPITGYGLI